MEWRMRNNNQNTTANERVRKNADVNLSVCHCYIGRWLNRERKSHNEFAFLFIFSLCTYYNVFFPSGILCVYFDFHIGRWSGKKKSSITLIRILDRIALHNWRAICHKFNNDDWQKKHRQTYKILISNRKQAAINIIVAHYRNALASGCWLSWLHCPNSFNANPRENVQFVRINGRWLIGQCEISSLTKWKLSFAKISALCTNSGRREPILTSRE